MELTREQLHPELVEFIVFPYRSQVNLVISRRSRAGTTKKCTEKRVARAELLKNSLRPLIFNVAVTVVVSLRELKQQRF